MFDFEPKFVWVFQDENIFGYSSNYAGIGIQVYPRDGFIWINGLSNLYNIVPLNGSNWTRCPVIPTVNGKNFSWYSTSGIPAQCNASNITYKYFAIG